MFFTGKDNEPVGDENYSSIHKIFICKYDKKGNELPFKRIEHYIEELDETIVSFEVYGKDLEFVSPNGSATFKMEYMDESDALAEYVGYEGETFFLIELDTSLSDMKGTIVEGETAQVTSPQDPGSHGLVEWETKEYKSKDLPGHPNPPVEFTSATTKNDNILVNGLSIGSSIFGAGRISNIMIGNEPQNVEVFGKDYLPGLHWNALTSQDNISIGRDNLESCQNVQQNITIGNRVLPELKEGSNNIAIGQTALPYITEGSNNTAIGNQAGGHFTKGSNNIFIGHNATKHGHSDNQVVLGQNTEELWLGHNKIFPFPDDLGGGGGGGPFIFHGTTAVTQPAPYDPVMGQMYFNKVAGKADSSWGLALDPDVEIPVNAVLIYDLVDPGTWGVIMSPNIGGSSGGGAGSSGGTTDILPVLYSGVVDGNGTVKEGTGFTCVKNGTGDYTVTLDKPIAYTSSINATVASSVGTVGYVIISSTEIGFFIQDKEYVGTDDRKDGTVSFTVTGTETIAVGGGTGGGGNVSKRFRPCN